MIDLISELFWLRAGLTPYFGHVLSLSAILALVLGACFSSQMIRSSLIAFLRFLQRTPSAALEPIQRLFSFLKRSVPGDTISITLPFGLVLTLHKKRNLVVAEEYTENKLIQSSAVTPDRPDPEKSLCVSGFPVPQAPPAPPPPIAPPAPPTPAPPSRVLASSTPIPSAPATPVALAPISTNCTPAPRRNTLKAFHWEKILTVTDENSIWNIEPGSVDCDLSALHLEVRMHFEKEELRRPGTPLSRGEDCAKLSTFLDSRRAQNLGILMRRIASRTLAIQQLCDALWTMNVETLHGDLLDTLLQAAPTDSEVALISKLEHIETLRKQEKFLVRMASVTDCRLRLQLLRSWEILPHRIRELQARVNRVQSSIDAVRKSSALRRALHVTLHIGNYLNHGLRQGQAVAFTIDSLNRLANTKSVLDKRKTLLHLLHDHANLTCLIEEFYCLRSAKHIDSDELQSDIEVVRVMLNPPVSKMVGEPPAGATDEYPKFLDQFRRRFSPRFERLVSAHEQLRIAACDMKRYLGLPDHKNPAWGSVFKSLAEFVDLVSKLADKAPL